MSEGTCAIWGTPAEQLSVDFGKDGEAYRSPRAGGSYFISRAALVNLRSAGVSERIKLTHEIVSHEILGSRIEISSTTVKALPTISSPTVTERASRLLTYLAKASKLIGSVLEFPPDYEMPESSLVVMPRRTLNLESAPLFAWSVSLEWDEVKFLLDMLAGEQLIRLSNDYIQPDIIVLSKGWARLERESTLAQPDQAFVAMWFDPKMEKAYVDGIERGIREAGFRPLRIDRKEHVNKIDDEIVAEIRRSRFLVADFTSMPNSPRGGVYFEAGFAMGRGIPVIWTCRADLIDQVHFDTRQFNHIVWDSPDSLCDRLRTRILAVIGEGPLARSGGVVSPV